MFKSTKFLGFGLGLRLPHEDEVAESGSKVDWFEVITENYLENDEWHSSRDKEILFKIRQDYPVVCHGVSLSIGAEKDLDFEYLKSCKKLYEELQPEWISDHLCWTGMLHHNAHDLLPLPYSEEAISKVVNKLDIVQNFYGRKLLLENVSSYAEFSESEMTEWEFLVRVARESGCGILLDINNIFVSSFNHGFDPNKYLDAIPAELVGQIHLAGPKDKGNHLIDTHSYPVMPEVWQLYRRALTKMGAISTMVEWDDNIPELSILEQEVLKAKQIYQELMGVVDVRNSL